MTPEKVLEELLLAYGRSRLLEAKGLSPESREALARAFATFATANARLSGLPAAKVVCRFRDFAAAEWSDWAGTSLRAED